MHPTDTLDDDEQQGRLHVWRVARWLITAAASLVLVTLFLTQTASTEAAAPVPNDTVTYHDMAAPLCQQGYNCLIQNCVSGNYYFCSYNLGANYPYNFSYAYGCGLGGLNCGVNYIAPAVYNFPIYNGVYNFPYYLGANNACAVGNFSCYRANYPFVGNPFYANGFFNGWYGNGWYGSQVNLGAPVRIKEVAQPAAATTPAAQPAAPAAVTQTAPVAAPAQVTAPVVAPVAAPAAPAANNVTALNAPVQAPAPAVVTAGSANVKIYSAPPATAPTAARDPDDHR